MQHRYTEKTDHWLPDWDAVIQNFDLCVLSGHVRELGMGGFVALNSRHHSYQKANILARELGPKVTLHTYISFSHRSETSGRHIDEEPVFCLQAIGQTQFEVWENDQKYDYILTAGDMLYIPSNVPHRATPLTPRVLLSYGDES